MVSIEREVINAVLLCVSGKIKEWEKYYRIKEERIK